DIVAVLTDSADPSGYWKKMRKRDPALGRALEGGGQFVPPLAFEFATAGGPQKMQCWNTEGILRLIQSIASPKAEPFKRWLARVGKERIDEIDNPELAMGRMQELYEKKGYPKEWIDKRLRGIAVRQDLTDEWKDRGASTSVEFAILTNEIMQGLWPQSRRVQTSEVAGTGEPARPHDRHRADSHHAGRGNHDDAASGPRVTRACSRSVETPRTAVPLPEGRAKTSSGRPVNR
ncbi:MAG TPA: hypothetical protein VGQ65_16655, partial [Thermoanaerobaculia bacterium]|nr:hypothetical protein [Thermoanaerobaculia bacterium]